MKTFFAAAFAGVASAAVSFETMKSIVSEHEREFLKYAAEWGKNYLNQAEYEFRLQNFIKKDKWIKEMNANPEHTFTVAHNMFSDWTKEEYSINNGSPEWLLESMNFPVVNELPHGNSPLMNLALPTSINWLDKAKVGTWVKAQGACASCWIFAAVGTVESYKAIKTGNLRNLSEQQVLDCCGSGQGCKGGQPGFALGYAA